MGHQVELKIAKTLARNHSLLRFGFTFESRGPRHNSNKYIMRNIDADRERRQEEQLAEQIANYEDDDEDENEGED